MMRWWSTTPKYGDEVRANSMTDYLVFWYRSLSERCDTRTLAAAPRTLRIACCPRWPPGVPRRHMGRTGVAGGDGQDRTRPCRDRGGRRADDTPALSQVIINGAALFHTSLYLTDMQAFLDDASARPRGAGLPKSTRRWPRSAWRRPSTGTRQGQTRGRGRLAHAAPR